MLRRFTAILLLCLGACSAWAAPDDQFIVAYNLIQQADQSRDPRAAVRLYEDARTQLGRLQRGYPSWNERVVNYRIRYCTERIATLQELVAKLPAQPTNTTASTNPAASTNALPAPDAPSSEVLEHFNRLNEQIRRLDSEKIQLQAKLREALSAQPAPVDPRELQAAVEKITALQSTNKALLSKLESQESERRNLVDKVVAEEANRALAETRRQLEEQKQSATRLQKERAELESQLQKVQDGSLKSLKLENQTLKAQVADLKSDTDKGRQVAELSARLTRIQSDLDTLKQRNDTLIAEKSALEKQVEDLKARQSEEGIVRIAKLETELAVARADAQRSSLKAEELAASLDKEKKERGELEAENKSLEERVSQLAARSAADAEALGTLQAALTAEKSERAQTEALLKAAEERLKVLASNANAAIDPNPSADLQLTGARAEVLRLQASIRASSQRETELQTALAQETTLRTRLQQEKSELERRLAEATAALRLRPATDPAATRSLEERLARLEKERDELKARLTQLTTRARTRLTTLNAARAATPRERASEFHLSR